MRARRLRAWAIGRHYWSVYMRERRKSRSFCSPGICHIFEKLWEILNKSKELFVMLCNFVLWLES